MAIFEIEIFVKLRVPDRVALTAVQTLTRMGFGDRLSGLLREDYYLISIEAADERAAVRTVTHAVEDTFFFANPNKHSVRIEPKRRPRSAGGETVVLTYGKGKFTADSLLANLKAAGFTDVVSVGSGILWTLETSESGGIAAAKDIVVTTSRERGLLINPHSEDYEII